MGDGNAATVATILGSLHWTGKCATWLPLLMAFSLSHSALTSKMLSRDLRSCFPFMGLRLLLASGRRRGGRRPRRPPPAWVFVSEVLVRPPLAWLIIHGRVKGSAAASRTQSSDARRACCVNAPVHVDLFGICAQKVNKKLQERLFDSAGSL